MYNMIEEPLPAILLRCDVFGPHFPSLFRTRPNFPGPVRESSDWNCSARIKIVVGRDWFGKVRTYEICISFGLFEVIFLLLGKALTMMIRLMSITVEVMIQLKEKTYLLIFY